MNFVELSKKMEEILIAKSDEEWEGLLEDDGRDTIHVSQILKCGLKRYYSYKHPEIVEKCKSVRSPDVILGVQFEVSMFEIIKAIYPNAISNYHIEVPFGKKHKLVGRLDVFIPEENIFFEIKKLTHPIRLDLKYNDETRGYIAKLEESMRSNIITVDDEGLLLDEIRDHYKEQIALYKYLSDCQGHFLVEARIVSKNVTFNQRIIIVNADKIEPMNESLVIHLINEHLKSLEGELIAPRYSWNCWYGNPPKKCMFYDICENPYKKPLSGGEV